MARTGRPKKRPAPKTTPEVIQILQTIDLGSDHIFIHQIAEKSGLSITEVLHAVIEKPDRFEPKTGDDSLIRYKFKPDEK